MDRKQKRNQSYSKKYKTDTYRKRMIELVKSIEQWVADIAKRETKIRTKYLEQWDGWNFGLSISQLF